MNTNFSLSKLNSLNTYFSIIIFSSILGIFIFNFNESVLEKRIEDLEKNFYDKNRALVKNEVQREISRIKTLNYTIFNDAEAFLIEKVNFVEKLLDNDKDSKNIKKIINKYNIALNSFKWDSNTGYLFMFDKNGQILFHAGDKNSVGKNIFELAKNKYDMIKFFEYAIENNEYYGSYASEKKLINEDIYISDQKYVYIKKLEKYDVYIAATTYKSEIEKKVLDLVFNNILTSKFGENKYGYFWINGYDNILKVHPLNLELVGKSLDNFKSLDGKQIFTEINELAKNGGGFVEYEWYRADNLQRDKKISYIEQIGDFPLVLGAGFYLTELNYILKLEKATLTKLSQEHTLNILIILILLSFLALVSSRYISTRISLIEMKEKENLNLLEQYKLLLDKTSVVSKTNLEGTITYVNDSFEKLSGYYKDEIIGKKHNILRHPDDSKNKFRKLWELIQKGNIWKGIMKNKDKYGNTYYNSTVIIPIKDAKNNIIEYISSGTDITNVYKLQEAKEKAYLYDELTGLRSKNGFNQDLENKNGTLILIDITDFSKINSLIGHLGADDILENFASIIKEKSNYVYRIYGDLFAIFYENISISQAEIEASTIISKIDKYRFIYKNIDIPLSVNIGISDIKPYLTTCEIAINMNKKTFNKISIYTKNMDEKAIAEKNFSMLNKIKVALENNNVRPFFQPIVDLNTKNIIKYEALVRLIDDYKVITPNLFLDIAKKSKLYPEITKRVLKQSIELVKKENVSVSINISYQDLTNVDILNYISNQLNSNKDIAHLLTFEILENDEINDYNVLLNFIKLIKNHNSQIAIDDFGSGYSNYTQILNLHPDIVKLDGSLIKKIHINQNSKDIVESILVLTKKRGIKTVAEFIDNESVHQVVKDMGIDFGQGYYYSEPMDLLSLNKEIEQN